MQPCFPQITRGEISNYRLQIEDFAKRFYLEGPGSVGEDLDSGENSRVRETGWNGGSLPCPYTGLTWGI